MEERLQKLLSACGLASRRTVEQWIEAGRVTVNGTKARLGDKADLDRDRIEVDGRPVTTLSDEKGRKTVAELVSGCGRRVWPVGRLDLDSEGLLLLTDDGELTQKLLHPSHQVEKEYLVWVTGDVSRGLPVLSGPMDLDGVPLSPAKVRRGRTSGGVTQLSITICQGKNRQVRRMCGQAGLKVLRLKRVREGGLCLDRTLGPGKWRRLEQSEVAALLQKP